MLTGEEACLRSPAPPRRFAVLDDLAVAEVLAEAFPRRARPAEPASDPAA
ncbi:unnamed protein product [[Actinomadura] parvosata subsp. kistnae]|nr:unnamed protein product [Actinomadura parvosata subsp. kistnae]